MLYWKERRLILFHRLPGMTNKKIQKASVKLISPWADILLWNSQIQSRNANLSTTTFGNYFCAQFTSANIAEHGLHQHMRCTTQFNAGSSTITASLSWFFCYATLYLLEQYHHCTLKSHMYIQDQKLAVNCSSKSEFETLQPRSHQNHMNILSWH